MRTTRNLLFLLALVQGQEAPAVMTLYKDGVALVKQPVEWIVNGGLTTVHTDNLPEGVLTDSPHLVISGAQILDQRLTRERPRGWNYVATRLGDFVEVKVTGEKSKSGILIELSSSTLTLQDKDEIVIIPRNRVDYITVEGALEPGRSSPEISWRLSADTTRTASGYLMYLSTGFSWTADYRMIMDEPGQIAELIVEAQISNNSQATFPNLKLHLVEGQLNRSAGHSPVVQRMRTMVKTAMAESNADFPVPEESGLGDFHIYRLQDYYSLYPGDILTTALYEPRKIAYRKTYVFQNSERGQREEPLEVLVEFDNTAENDLNIPLPAGSMKMYLNTKTSMEFLGEDRLKPVLKGGTVKLNGGRAFDVTGKRRILNYSRQRKSEEASIELTVINQRTEPIQVKFIEHISGDWVIRDQSTRYIKEDANTIYFPVTIASESSQVITYTYRKSWN
ncbi:MAG: hypothetical protein GXO90_05670 [FCB group bacterium]|nr:hypothetical protein [FCB group bacterium]